MADGDKSLKTFGSMSKPKHPNNPACLNLTTITNAFDSPITFDFMTTNIESKLEAKRKELEAANEQQMKLWHEFKQLEAPLDAKRLEWHKAMQKQEAIGKEIAVLETVLNEMASV